MNNYVLIRNGDVITIKYDKYKEDDWFIEIKGKSITLYEIPLFGGTPNKIGQYASIAEALDDTHLLT